MITKESLMQIVGPDRVSQDKTVLEAYAGDMSFVNSVRPRYVVMPRDGRAIQNLVKLANDTATPLVPVSSGPPHMHGDTVPGTGGSVIVDLSGMKKIVRIDRPHRVAMVEPGVTFEELIPEVEKAGLRLNMPLLPRRSKTVVGSMLEREPAIMPKYHWDISDPLACLEIVFGNGEIFRTGQAAGPGTIEEQWAAGGAQKTPYGPGPASWYRIVQGAQGTMGIVTWASLRCEILPQIEEPFIAGSSDLGKLFDLAHWLVRLRMVNECLLLNDHNLAAIMTAQGAGDFQSIKDTLPPWALFFNVAGYDYFPEERIDSLLKGISDIAGRIGVEPARAAGKVSAVELLNILKRPSPDPYWKMCRKGASQDIFFLATYANIASLIGIMHEMADAAGYAASDVGVYVQPIVQGSNCHCEFNLYYDPANVKEASRIRSLSVAAIKSLMAAGAFFSRPGVENARMIINRDAAYVAALTKVKTILDPNRIMNPGKLCF